MKAYTDISQSKKLAEILPLESADMARFTGKNRDVYPRDNVIMTNYILAKKEFSICGEIPIEPCWSLAALLDVLPEGIIENYYALNLQKENGKYSIAYGDDELLCIADNPIDTCYEIIIKLYEQKIL